MAAPALIHSPYKQICPSHPSPLSVKLPPSQAGAFAPHAPVAAVHKHTSAIPTFLFTPSHGHSPSAIPAALLYLISIPHAHVPRRLPSAILSLAAASAFGSSSSHHSARPTPCPAALSPPTPLTLLSCTLCVPYSFFICACPVCRAPISLVIRVLELGVPFPFQGPVRTPGGEGG